MKASEIDPVFYRGDKKPKASNVGQLIKQLQRLPKSLSLKCFNKGIQLTVYNIREANKRHLQIEDTWE